MEEINLTDATRNQIAQWVRQFKLPDTLVEHFESGKLKAAYFFIDNKAAEKARTTELKDLKFTPLEITAINNNKQRQIRVSNEDYVKGATRVRFVDASVRHAPAADGRRRAVSPPGPGGGSAPSSSTVTCHRVGPAGAGRGEGAPARVRHINLI